MPGSRPSFGKPCQSSDMVTIHAGGHTASVNQKVAGTFESFAKQYDQQIEKIHSFGGYNCRNIAGSGTWSNHAWGLAMDINASQHAQGRHGTFSGSQLHNLRQLLTKFPHIRWGGDYHTTVDEMHFEWMGNSNQGSAATSGGGSGALAAFSPIGQLLEFFTNENYVARAAQVVGGALLLIIGFLMLALHKPVGAIMGMVGEGAKNQIGKVTDNG